MLKITFSTEEEYDELLNEFVPAQSYTLLLEHSLVSVSRWESKWGKPFLSDNEKTREEVSDYIRCMTINANVDPKAYSLIPDPVTQKISEYIKAPMTATTIKDDRRRGRNREILTSEIIYYWMIALNIPVQFERWHLNRLLTLISVCSIKNGPQSKMSKRETISKYKELNQARRAALHTKG